MATISALSGTQADAGTDPFRLLDFGVRLDDSDSQADAIDALGLAPFLVGDQPFSVTVRVERVRREATLLPAGMVPLRKAIEGDSATFLAAGDGWTLVVYRWNDNSARVTATAVDEDLARGIVDAATLGAVEPDGPDDETVPMGFWYLRGDGGPRRRERLLDVTEWDLISRNYPPRSRAALTRLMAVTPERIGGRLVLLHGPPGTGKTSALRSLANAWRDWCQVDCVLDPEALFDNPGYLMKVVDRDDDADPPREWRLVILEDCDELIRADAKRATGQALSRLLNLTDGLLGQGSRLLVALTTNEEPGKLHQAVIRPGRCLAEIEAGRFSQAEATEWLGRSDGIGPGGATLAELYDLDKGTVKVESREPGEGGGQYL
jgi:hypothetical protein